MDHTKCKTFIGFVNVDKKDRWWVDGNSVWDTISPRILPYETKEEKESAKLYGYSTATWSETGDEVVGVIFKVHETIPVITKKEADIIEQKQRKQHLEEKQKILDEENIPKKKEEKIVKEVVKEIPKVVAPIIPEVKKRGRPRIHPLIEE
jgi:hypothetical protein